MAANVIDEFWVKPEGIFASKRYIRVLVDDNGIISNQNVPGKEIINEDRISDYKSNGRQYGVGNQITQFCNFITHARYTVIAQDERPFAYVVDELDVPACGFEEPLPEPNVPFNPFGNLVYNPYKFFDYCDWDGAPISVLIEKKDYTGDPIKILAADGVPIKIIRSEVEDITVPIRATQVEFGIMNAENFATEEFYTEDERTFRITVTKDGNIEFRGYIIPDNCQEEFVNPNYISKIRCSDGLGSLKTVSYPVQRGQKFDYKQSFIGVICYCLSAANLNLDIATVVNFYSENMPTGLDDDPLDMAMISPFRFATDKGEIMTCYEVLSEVCKAWGAFIVQDGGKWRIVRTKELAVDSIRQRLYNYTGLRINASVITSQRVIGGAIR